MNLNNIFTPVNPDGSVREDLAAFLRVFGIDTTLPIEELAKLTMDKWVIKDSERWEQPEIVLEDADKAVQFWAATKELPLYHELTPAADYDYADHLLFFGGTLPPQDRKYSLGVDLWDDGMRFGSVVLLGGDRVTNDTTEALNAYSTVRPGGLPIDPSWKSPSAKPTTEADMMRELWLRSLIPAGMRKLPTAYISAKASGGRQRANIDDTCAAWLATNPKPGKVLGLTVCPHVLFQYWELVRILGKHGFTVDMAASTAELGPQRPDYFTGAVANWLDRYVKANA